MLCNRTYRRGYNNFKIMSLKGVATNMKIEIQGLCELNKKGILKLYNRYGNQIPAIKRHAENILNNKQSKIQYCNALNLSEILKIDLDEIIEI